MLHMPATSPPHPCTNATRKCVHTHRHTHAISSATATTFCCCCRRRQEKGGKAHGDELSTPSKQRSSYNGGKMEEVGRF